MKRKALWFIVLITAMNITVATVAQELPSHPPFVQEGKVWEVNRGVMWMSCEPWGWIVGPISEPYTKSIYYTMRGDTIVSGKEMKKLFRTDSYKYGDDESHYFAAVREEGSLVYIVYAGQEEEHLLYDFRPEGECDSISFTDLWNHLVPDYPLCFDMTVTRDRYYEEDTLAINGYLTRRFWTDFSGVIHNIWYRGKFPGEKPASDESFTVEGFGCVDTDPFDVSVWLSPYLGDVGQYVIENTEQFKAGNYEEVPNCTIYTAGSVRKVYLEDRCIADRLWGLSPFIEPMDPTAVADVRRQEAKTSIFYDLQGRRLDHEPTRGMYIKDGRKYLKR